MASFFQGWGFTVAAIAVITVVFAVAQLHLARELRWVRVLTDHLGYLLVADGAGSSKPDGSLLLDAIRAEAQAVVTSADPAWAQKQVRTWQMRAQRLESALAFWIDLLRQLGLLGTVVGLGLSLAIGGNDATRLLGPLGLAVWTTVAGLAYSIWLSATFGMKLAAWVDACEKNLEAWDAGRLAGGPR
jgi:biopolymer transport protein ExbB/TolQ